MPIPSFRHLDDETLVLPVAIEEEAGRLLGVVREVYREIGPGLGEAIYQEALTVALEDEGISHRAKARIPVTLRGRILSSRPEPDFLVGDHIVLELKSAEGSHPSHRAQLLTYLRLTRRPLGFLVNYRAPTLAQGIRRVVLK